MNGAKKIFSGIKWTYANAIISSIYGFFSVPILLDYFGKANIGLIALATSLNVYLQLMDLGISGTTIRYFATWIAKNDKEKTQKLFGTSLFFLSIIGLVNTLILLFVCHFSDVIFNIDQQQASCVKLLLIILGINAFFSWATSPIDQIIKAGENVAWLQKRALFPTLFQVAILILTIVFKLKLPIYFALSTFSYLIILPITIHKAKSLYPFIKFKPNFDLCIFKEILSYSISIFSFGIFQFSMLNLRPVILGIQCDIESVADFKIMNGIIGMVLTISSCFFSVMLPSSTRVVAQGNEDAKNKITYDGTKYITIILSLMIFGGIVVGDYLLQIYVGKSFSNLHIWLSIWLLSLFVQHNQAISTLIFAGTNLKPIAYISAFSTIIGLVLCWFLSPLFKVGGTVIGYFVYTLSQTTFYYAYYWPKVMHIDSRLVFRYSFAPPFLCGLICATCSKSLISLFNLSTVSSFLFAGCSFTIIYLILTYFVVINNNDKEFLLKLLR